MRSSCLIAVKWGGPLIQDSEEGFTRLHMMHRNLCDSGLGVVYRQSSSSCDEYDIIIEGLEGQPFEVCVQFNHLNAGCCVLGGRLCVCLPARKVKFECFFCVSLHDNNSRSILKNTLGYMHLAKIQIILHNRAVWSEVSQENAMHVLYIEDWSNGVDE